ncbi:hypothetical protein FKM82_029773 [Ascaphus truei]
MYVPPHPYLVQTITLSPLYHCVPRRAPRYWVAEPRLGREEQPAVKWTLCPVLMSLRNQSVRHCNEPGHRDSLGSARIQRSAASIFHSPESELNISGSGPTSMGADPQREYIFLNTHQI